MTAPAMPANDDERVAALMRSNALTEGPRPALRVIAEEAARRAHAPVGLITFVAANSAWIQAATGLSEGEVSRHSAFCAWAIHSLEVLWIEDTILDARYSDNPLVLSDPFIRFYAGAPIATPQGYALGAICVMDHVPRVHLYETSDMLRELSVRVSNLLEESSPT